MKRKRTPNTLQEAALSAAIQLLNTRVGRNFATTTKQLESLGHVVQWSRVTWTGGVGSYRWMPRRGKFRILVSATKSGFHEGKVITQYPMPGVISTYRLPNKKVGFRYGHCIEI